MRNLNAGLSPDSCFYIKGAPSIAGKRKVDLNANPPPDLVVEIDITTNSLGKPPVYAALGVSEVWRWVGDNSLILVLRNGSYIEAASSEALPFVAAKDVVSFVNLSGTKRPAAWLREVQDWAVQQYRRS